MYNGWHIQYNGKKKKKRLFLCNPLSPLIQRPAETLRCVVCDLCWRMVGRPKDSTRETRRRFRNWWRDLLSSAHQLSRLSSKHTPTHSWHLWQQNSWNLRVTPRYKQHHSKQVIIYRTRLQRCLAAWHIHYLTFTTDQICLDQIWFYDLLCILLFFESVNIRLILVCCINN